MYADLTNGWTSGQYFSEAYSLLRNKICINFCFDGNENFYLQQKYVSIFLKAPTHVRLDLEVKNIFSLLVIQSASKEKRWVQGRS